MAWRRRGSSAPSASAAAAVRRPRTTAGWLLRRTRDRSRHGAERLRARWLRGPRRRPVAPLRTRLRSARGAGLHAVRPGVPVSRPPSLLRVAAINGPGLDRAQRSGNSSANHDGCSSRAWWQRRSRVHRQLPVHRDKRYRRNRAHAMTGHRVVRPRGPGTHWKPVPAGSGSDGEIPAAWATDAASAAPPGLA